MERSEYKVKDPNAPETKLLREKHKFYVRIEVKQFPWDEPLHFREREIEAETMEEAVVNYIMEPANNLIERVNGTN